MFCIKCGKEIPENSAFCPICGARQNTTSVYKQNIYVNQPKVILDPKEVNHTPKEIVDSGHTMQGSAPIWGIALMIVGGLCDLVTMFLVFDGSLEDFKLFTILGTILFIVGLFTTFFGSIFKG